MTVRYPRIRLSGEPYERGVQYGTQGKAQILKGREGYERNFRNSGLSWTDACLIAQRYADPIQRHFPGIWEEIEGIARGAELPVIDILAMNCRTEIMWDQANRTGRKDGIIPECSSFGISPDRTAHGRPLIGQNWDWLVHSFDSVVLLEVEREEGPNYVTIVEAGLLGKFAMNSAGFTLSVNTLVTSADIDTSGLPFHVLLRALVDCQTTYDAVELLSSVQRASSGNYLVGTPDGAMLDIECEPGGIVGVHVLPLVNGQITHTNHFVSTTRAVDLASHLMSDTFVRYQRISDRLAATPRHTVDSLHSVLTDHTGAPGSICCHPDPRSPEATQWASVCSIVFDPLERTLHMCEGLPCETEREAIVYRDLLGGAS